MISIHYNIKINFIANIFNIIPSQRALDMQSSLTYGIENIGRVIQTKTFFHEKEPLLQVRLNNVDILDIKEIEKNNVITVLNIYQNGDIIYRNYYKSFKVKYLKDSSVNNLPEDRYDVEIYFNSLIIEGLNLDKSLSKLAVSITDMIGYSTIKDIVLKDFPKEIKETYGDGLKIKNFCNYNYATTAYKNILFPIENSNKENIELLLDRYKFTLNPFLYGYDEGFADKSLLTELIIVDLLTPDEWYNLDNEAVEFFQSSVYRNQSEGRIINEDVYYSESKATALFNSTLIIKNKTSGDIYKLNPLIPGQGKAPIFIYQNGAVNIKDQKASNIRTTTLETMLSKKDFENWLNNQYELYKKKSFFQTMLVTGAPYNAFRLGRKFPQSLTGHNSITVGPDIYFEPIPNKNDPSNVFTPVKEKGDPYKCRGSIFLLSGL